MVGGTGFRAGLGPPAGWGGWVGRPCARVGAGSPLEGGDLAAQSWLSGLAHGWAGHPLRPPARGPAAMRGGVCKPRRLSAAWASAGCSWTPPRPPLDALICLRPERPLPPSAPPLPALPCRCLTLISAMRTCRRLMGWMAPPRSFQRTSRNSSSNSSSSSSMGRATSSSGGAGVAALCRERTGWPVPVTMMLPCEHLRARPHRHPPRKSGGALLLSALPGGASPFVTAVVLFRSSRKSGCRIK